MRGGLKYFLRSPTPWTYFAFNNINLIKNKFIGIPKPDPKSKWVLGLNNGSLLQISVNIFFETEYEAGTFLNKLHTLSF